MDTRDVNPIRRTFDTEFLANVLPFLLMVIKSLYDSVKAVKCPQLYSSSSDLFPNRPRFNHRIVAPKLNT